MVIYGIIKLRKEGEHMQVRLKEMCGKKAYELIKAALREKQNIVITGTNNTGKSMCLRAIVEKLPAYLTIRTNSASLQNLREVYPTRNILVLQEGSDSKEIQAKLNETVILADDMTASGIDTLFRCTADQVILAIPELSDEVARKIVGGTKSVLLIEMALSNAGKCYISKVVDLYSSDTGVVRATLCERSM